MVALQHLLEFRRKQLPELRVDLVDAKIDPLRLPDQPVDLLEPLLKFLNLWKVDAREVLTLIDEPLRFSLQRLDLIIDLAQRPRRGEQALRIIGRVEHTDLGRNRGTGHADARSEEHTSELQSLMSISYAVFCLKT